jgi:hypothetical protein
MARTNNPTRFGLKVVRALRKLLAVGDDLGVASLSVAVPPSAGDLPTPHTVDLADDEQGTYMCRRRKLPRVAAFSGDDPEALRLTWLAILEAHTPPRHSADFPY